ncbi:tyrosine-type recombinase/integrase [Rhodococcus sp. NPDC003318]|uniref:tyrosine-type recombinase/integrase n=1 Tax=Rhodococcus sp. NPDC003318 TaxID=3364503 RepID=UPI0036C66048
MTVPDGTRSLAVSTIPTSRNDLLVAGFLARYSARTTFESYRTDLRIFFQWCSDHGLDPIDDVTRPHLELFARHLEIDRGNAPATVHRRLAVLRTFFWILEEDEVIPKSPARNVRMPKLQYDRTRTLGLTRAEFGRIVESARWSDAPECEEAMVTVLGVLGLRVTELCSLDIENCRGYENGHRVVRFVGKGGKPATMPMPAPVARTVDKLIGDRTTGPLFVRRDGTRMTRRSAARVVDRLGKAAKIEKRISPHSFRNTMITAALDAGVPLRDVQHAARHSTPAMTIRYDQNRHSLDRHAAYVVSSFIAS